MRLYDISDDMLALDKLIEEHLIATEGELTPDVEAAITVWMNENVGNLKSKMDGYAAIIVTMKRLAEFHKAEKERQAKREKTRNATAKFLLDRLLPLMKLHKIDDINTGRFDVSIVKNGGVLPLIVEATEDQIPNEYKTTVTETHVDNKKIREALESGVALPFARLGDRGERISIR